MADKTVSPGKAGKMKARIAGARKQLKEIKQRPEGRPLGGPEVKMPLLKTGEQPGAPVKPRKVEGPGGPTTPMPPGAGVGAAYAENRERSFGKDPLKDIQPGQAVQVGAEQPQPQGPPQEGETRHLREETVQGLEALSRAQSGNVAVPPAPPGGEEAAEAAQPPPEDRDDLLFSTGMDETEDVARQMQGLLMNKERREAIEARCQPMSFDDWVANFEVQQRVPIIPGKFEPMFRTPSGHEDLFGRRKMSGVRGSDNLVFGTYSIVNLTLALVDINGEIDFPNHLKPDGTVDEEIFDAKMAKVLRMPMQWLADLSVNYMWFDVRARQLLTLDEVKNG